MKTTKLLTLTVAAGSLLAFTAQAAVNTMIGTGHDFSSKNFNNNPADPNTVCGVCHTPHRADSITGPLWGHDTVASGATWVMYSSNSPSANIHYSPAIKPNPSSLACLSCHDGSITVNAYGDVAAPNRSVSYSLASEFVISEGSHDLSHSHPISFKYSDVVGNTPGKNKYISAPINQVLAPDLGTSPKFEAGTDMSIGAFLLDSKGNVECSSCHDVHAQIGSAGDGTTLNPYLLKINGTQGGVGSLLCRSCHIK